MLSDFYAECSDFAAIELERIPRKGGDLVCVLVHNGQVLISAALVFRHDCLRFAGMDCHAEERDFLADFEKYYNNAYLSDVTLIVGDEM